MILPLERWLQSQVTDLDIDILADKKTVTAIRLLHNGKEEIIHTTENDLVFVTNVSMTENSTTGSMHEPAKINRGNAGYRCFFYFSQHAVRNRRDGKILMEQVIV